MARTVRGGNLERRTARLKLEPRARPYWRETGKPGLHLGYRRLERLNGTWIARRYGGQGGKYTTKAFAQADDYADSDGQEILDYYGAMGRLAGEAPPVRHGNPYSVADAVRDYVSYLKREKKTASDAASRLEAYVLPHFGDRPLASLARADFDKWLEWAFTHKPRGRTRNGQPSALKKPAISAAERARRRKSTMTRVINYMLGCFNRAVDQGHVPSGDAWAAVRKFKGADSARIVRLTTAEATRLLNACPPDFRQLVEAALLTGCRYGELTNLRARDFESRTVTRPGANPGTTETERHGTMLVADSKAAKPRRVPLTAEGVRFFESLSAGRAPDDLLLTKADGAAWGKSEQFRRIRAACTAANIIPAVNFHGLRHTTASLLVEAGTPLAFVAEILGHSDTRMVSKHYAHLAPSHVAAAIRANLPTFGVQIDSKVTKIRP
ncbi:MAG: tyrosine-type recombinase/integrase [Steroidobacteraceae bacterium]